MPNLMSKNEIQPITQLPLLQPRPPEKEKALTLKQVLAGVFRGKLFLATFMTLGTLIGAFMAISTPNFYTSTGSFVARNAGETRSLNPLNIENAPARLHLQANAQALLYSDELLLGVINRLGPNIIVSPYQPKIPSPSPDESLTEKIRRPILKFQKWANDPGDFRATRADALLALRSNLGVEMPRRSELINVSYTTNDPLLAQKILKTYMEEARKQHVRAYTDSNLDDVKKDFTKSKEAFQKAEGAYQQFLNNLKVQDFEEELKQAQEEARVMRTEETKIKNKIETSKIILDTLKKRIKTIPQYTEVEEPITEPRPKVTVLQNRIQELETDLEEAKSKFVPGNREIKRLSALLKTKNKELDEELKKDPLTRIQKRKILNSDYSSTDAKIQDLKIELEVAQNSLLQTKKQLDHAQKRLSRLLAKRDRYSQLKRKLKAADRDLELEEDRLALAKKKAKAALEGSGSLQIIAKANLPLEKDGPARAKMTIGGLLGGFFFALVLLLLKTITDTQVHDPEDLEEIEGVKVLASVPKLKKRDMRRHQNLRIRTWG
jgi:uncharacterized protein involved in exopolysaccharide biosynthesis